MTELRVANEHYRLETMMLDELEELEGLLHTSARYATSDAKRGRFTSKRDKVRAELAKRHTKMTALYEFAKRIKPGDTIEFLPYDDGSAVLTAISNRGRTVALTLQRGQSDGSVYDYRHSGTERYVVYEPEGGNNEQGNY